MTRMKLKIFKIDESKYMLNASSPKFNESLIFDSESDAEKTAQFTEKVFGGENEKVEVYTGENEGNSAVTVIIDKKVAHVFTSEDENVAAAVTMFVKIIAMKIKSAAKVKQ